MQLPGSALATMPGMRGAIERLQQVGMLDQVRRRRRHDVERHAAAARAGDGARPLVGQLDGMARTLMPVWASKRL